MDQDPTTLATGLRRTERRLIVPGTGSGLSPTWSTTVAAGALAARTGSHHPHR